MTSDFLACWRREWKIITFPWGAEGLLLRGLSAAVTKLYIQRAHQCRSSLLVKKGQKTVKNYNFLKAKLTYCYCLFCLISAPKLESVHIAHCYCLFSLINSPKLKSIHIAVYEPVNCLSFNSIWHHFLATYNSVVWKCVTESESVSHQWCHAQGGIWRASKAAIAL